MRKYKCAIIGCGRIGCGFDDKPSKKIRTHAKAYFRNHATKIVALCDIDERKLKKYGKKYHVKNLYKDADDMFSKENLDILSICTLARSHLNLVKKAVNNGVQAIFLEKPISNSLKSAKEITEICKKNSVTLVVDHQRRFDPFYHSLKHFIKRNGIGRIHHVNIHYGGGITNTGTHIFDILRLIFGEVKYVSANPSLNKSVNKFDPNLEVYLKFKTGIQCFLHALDLSNYGICEMDIFGTKGRIILNLITNKINYYVINYDNYQDYRNLKKVTSPIEESKYAFDISLGLSNLIESMEKTKKPLCDGEDGYKSLELAMGSIVSAKERSIIEIPLRNKDNIILSR